jgi:NAD(P)-dependent dehydrogenase (short-subunit alcohol dehydrogenase family)
MDLHLKNHHVLITGGSKGIGLACAKVFLEEGAKVSLVSRDQANLETAKKELSAQNPAAAAHIAIYAADLKDAVLRLKIDEELKHKQWDVTVVKLMDHFGFVKHPRFNEYIYFRLDIIKNPHFKTITERDSLNVFIKTKFNNKKSEWGFIVSSGEILKKFSEH